MEKTRLVVLYILYFIVQERKYNNYGLVAQECEIQYFSLCLTKQSCGFHIIFL